MLDISWHYARNWLVLDLCSTVQLEFISIFTSGVPKGSSAVRLLRLLRLIKLLKLERARQIVASFQDRFQAKSTHSHS